MCVECSMQTATRQSVDFCFTCNHQGSDRLFVGDESWQAHNPNHHLLQLRIVQHYRQLHSVHKVAKGVIPILDRTAQTESDDTDSSSSSCVMCKTAITRPFFYCMECEDETFLCKECNYKVEKRQPWLFEHKPHSDPERPCPHEWAHILVLVPAPHDEPTELIPTISDLSSRLDDVKSEMATHLTENSRIQDRLESRMGEITARMLGLESLLRRLLPADDGNKNEV